MPKLNERLRELRYNHNLKQKDIALLVNIAQTTYAGYETGKTVPSLEVLNELSKHYKVTTDYLIGKSNIKVSADYLKLTNDINLDSKELYEKYNFYYGEQKLSKEEFGKMLEMARILFLQKKD